MFLAEFVQELFGCWNAVHIFASGDLDEDRIQSLLQNGAKIDSSLEDHGLVPCHYVFIIQNKV